jgi:aryl-phospho-beta-D-glucosidase BglC (GH1 family)
MTKQKNDRKLLFSPQRINKASMKRYTTILFVILVSAALELSLVFSYMNDYVTIKSSGIIKTVLPLHVEGRYIKDQTGKVVILRGINKAGFEDSPNGCWIRPDGSYTDEWEEDTIKANLDAMKSWGMNIVRMYGTARYWINNTENHREKIKQLATLCAERGMYLLYTFWHKEPQSPQEDQLWPSSTFPNREAFVNFWASIAQELKSYPNVLFSLWNEPQYSAPSESEWFAAFQECINAIRDAGAENIISVEWGGIWVDIGEARKYGVPTDHKVDWAFALYWVGSHPLNDPLGNLIYEFHNYRDAFQIWDKERQEYRFPYSTEELLEGYEFALVNYVLNTLNKTVICGEIGPNMWLSGAELEEELTWYSNALKIFNEKDLNYIAFWWWPTWKHAHLVDGAPNYQPNQAGQILMERIAE